MPTTTETRPASSSRSAASSAIVAPSDAPNRATLPVESGRFAAATPSSVAFATIASVSSPLTSPGTSGTSTRNPARASPRASRCTSGWARPSSVAPLRKTNAGQGPSPSGRTSVVGTPATAVSSTCGSPVSFLTTQVSTGVSRVVASTTVACACAEIHDRWTMLAVTAATSRTPSASRTGRSFITINGRRGTGTRSARRGGARMAADGRGRPRSQPCARAGPRHRGGRARRRAGGWAAATRRPPIRPPSMRCGSCSTP